MGAAVTIQPLHFLGFNQQPLKPCEMIKKEKTNIMTGKMIFPPWIAQADEKKP
nr:hypothetical protein [Desulfobulbus propionicus]